MLPSIARSRSPRNQVFPKSPRPIARFLLLASTAMLSTTAMAPAADAAPARVPNIVLIMADDMGYECVAANGGESYQTPHLDAMARRGMRFTNCHSQPICTPSRVQIMTGVYNSRNYIRFGLLDPQATTFAHVLKKAGYATCVVGKWQLQGGLDGPGKFGFDEYCLWQLTVRKSRYPNPTLETNGKVQAYSAGEYGPDLVSDYLCDFMERHKEGPFFAYYPMILPHWPFEPTPDSKDWDPAAEGVLKGTGKAKYFADMVAYTDKMVGKVLAKIDALGIGDQTLVIFTGDNGTYTGITSRLAGRDYQGGKGNLSEHGVHVPMIALRPGTTPAGQVNHDLIDFTDLLPTLAELGQAEVPKLLALDGRSFAPQLRGEAGNPRAWSYCWYYRNGTPKDAGGGETARTRRYKLYSDGRFFDIVNDPDQKQPLNPEKLTPEQRETVRELEQVIKAHTRPGFVK